MFAGEMMFVGKERKSKGKVEVEVEVEKQCLSRRFLNCFASA